MPRKYVVTGAASGIGKATAELLESQGHEVIGVDIRDADINVDLTKPEDRARLVAEVTEKSGGSINAIIAVAGLSHPIPATVGVNYFGMVSSLEDLRPLLVGSDAPRAVGVGSMASLHPTDEELVELQLAGDEAGALARAEVLVTEAEGAPIYASTKNAFARWIRRNAATPEWAGEGIPLNAVAPGVIITPMTAELTATEEAREALLGMVPMPLNGFAEAITVAQVLVWLASPENTHLCGQVIFVDGGSDVVIRGDATF